MKFCQVAIFGICSFCMTAYAADAIVVQHAHPLSALALELQQRYGYAVTYEEAPFDTAKLHSQQLANGRSFLSLPVVSMSFQMNGLAVGAPVAGVSNRVPAGLPDVVLPLLSGYHQADGGAFTALFEGGYAHIIPVNRIVNGTAQPFQAILGTAITLKVESSSCSAALDSLLAQVNSARGVQVVRGIVPMGPLMGRDCSVNVTGLPARDVLASILAQAGTVMHPPSTTVYAWALLYDPNTDKYFLSTSIVPDLSAKAPVVNVPTAPAPTGSGTTTGPSRLSAPTTKKR